MAARVGRAALLGRYAPNLPKGQIPDEQLALHFRIVLLGRCQEDDMRIRSIALLLGLISAFPVSATAAERPGSSGKVSSDDVRGAGVLELLKPISLDTKWADLPEATRVQLQALADHQLATYRLQWGGQALAVKQTTLLESPTPQMILAEDRYYRASYRSFLPSTFTLQDLKAPTLRKALILNYLGVYAAVRAGLTYPNGTLPNFDWDGSFPFDSVRLPDQQTYEEIKAYNRGVVEALSQVDDSSLGELEKKLKEYALFSARSNAEGSRGDSYGSDYIEQACDIAELNYDILAGYEGDRRRPTIFASDEAVLRDVNALYLNNTPLKWLDVGTRASALSYCMTPQDRIRTDVGDPATNDVAKGMILLQNWWVERLNKAAAQSCSIYSSQDRVRIWDAFSADQQFNNDSSSTMETYVIRLKRYKAQKLAHYHELAQIALTLVFPDEAVLTQAQQRKVVTAIGNRTDFGLFTKRIAEELDAAQDTVNGPAAQLWKSTVEHNVEYIGGNYSFEQSARPDEIEKISKMFEEVMTWVARNYTGYPIDISSLFKHIRLEVNTKNNAFTDNGTAKISIGVGTSRSTAEYYSWLLHELRHAVMYAWIAAAPDKSSVRYDEGPALEGSGVAVEDLLLSSFLKGTAKTPIALALYTLDYGIRDARFAGTTDATLQKYLRSDCDLDTIEFTKRIAEEYGLVGKLAETVAERAHAGTQYLQYVWGGLHMLDELAYLQMQVDPSEQHRVDPFVLFGCGLNTPRRDEAYIDALRACIN